MDLTARVRRAEIARLADALGSTNVEELSARFGVTASTIRRDLAALSAAGTVTRTYGGAVPVSRRAETSLHERFREAFAAKQAIATWAASRIAPGDTVFLDAGSTVAAMTPHLRARADVTIVTPSLAVVTGLSDAVELRIECLGGTLRPITQGFVGPLAEAAVERFTFDAAFLGTDGVTARSGICEADLVQSRLKELVMRRADAVYVLAHAAKLGRQPFRTWTKPPAGWTVVTDDAVTDVQLSAFESSAARVTVVGPDGAAVGR